MTFKQQDRFQNSPLHYTQQDFYPHYQTILCTSHDYHTARPGQSNSQFKAITIKVKKQKTVKVSPPCRMITTNHSSSQCSGHHHFSRFNYDAKAYTADADIENLDCFSEKE